MPKTQWYLISLEKIFIIRSLSEMFIFYLNNFISYVLWGIVIEANDNILANFALDVCSIKTIASPKLTLCYLVKLLIAKMKREFLEYWTRKYLGFCLQSKEVCSAAKLLNIETRIKQNKQSFISFEIKIFQSRYKYLRLLDSKASVK